jgi:hypothetical protein
VPLPHYIAIVSLTRQVSMRSLLQATAAVQKQITRDFTPLWHVAATVDAFTDLLSVPNDYCPVVLFDEPAELADMLEAQVGARPAERLLDALERDSMAGIHLNAYTRQPFALVSASTAESWTVVLSHEILEMLADPSGNRLVAAAHPCDREQRVKYLVEVCDPCMSLWYPVNGVPVADFFTPRYFDPVKVDGVRYSFTGSLKEPRHILDGGYLTFLDPRDSALYLQLAGDGHPAKLVDLDELALSAAPLRTIVDANRRTPRVSLDTLRPADSVTAADGPLIGVDDAAAGSALSMAEALYSLATGAG